MPITQYNSSVRQMSQSKFNSMKNASGKIPDLANQIVMTNSEDTNISCLRTEVVYDMTSSDASKNWGYTNGIYSDTTVSNKDFSKFSALKVYICAKNNSTVARDSWGRNNILEIDLDNLINIEYGASNLFRYANNNNYFGGTFVAISSDKKSLTFLFYDNEVLYSSSSTAFIYKIEGVLKTPSMIYTGDELIAGNGISLNNGIISQKQRCSVNISGFNDTHYSSPGWLAEGVIISGTFTKYDEASSLLISYASSSFYVTGGGSAYCKVSIDDINVEHSDTITNSSNETHSISKTVIATNISAGTHSFKWTCWSDASNRKANIAAYNTYSIAIQEI